MGGTYKSERKNVRILLPVWGSAPKTKIFDTFLTSTYVQRPQRM